MARLFLINPPTDETVRTPLLSFMYLASALRRAGHEVAILDCSAPFGPKDAKEIFERACAWKPTLIGLHCKTLYAQDTYALAKEFSGCGIPLVCGGPHATVAPLEPLQHGFDFSVKGEGEETLTELCDALDGKRTLDSVRSLAGKGFANPSRGFLLELDELAAPVDALDLFDPAWYGAKKTV